MAKVVKQRQGGYEVVEDTDGTFHGWHLTEQDAQDACLPPGEVSQRKLDKAKAAYEEAQKAYKDLQGAATADSKDEPKDKGKAPQGAH